MAYDIFPHSLDGKQGAKYLTRAKSPTLVNLRFLL